MNNPGVKKISILKINDNKVHPKDDFVAVEAPLEIRLILEQNGHRSEQPLSITMRTPGNDENLATGFLFTEGLISQRDQISNYQQVEENILSIEIIPELDLNLSKLQRHFYTSSSCGVCGKTSIDLVKTKTNFAPTHSTFTIQVDQLWGLQNKLKHFQKLFDRTGGIHAAALFNNNAEIILLREDVGRHNAVDKLIGEAFKKGLFPLYEYFIMVSGRASFELIQKASMAGIPVLVAVGAPSSLAIELAEEQGMSLVGFLKNNSLNVYSHTNRIGHGEK